MMETVFGIILAILSLYGLVGLIRLAALKIAAPKSGESRMYMVMLKGENADIELQMAMDTCDWDIALIGAEKYAVDCGLDSATKEICSKLCKGTEFVFLNHLEMSDKFISKGISLK